MCYDGKRRNFHYSEQISKKRKNFHYSENSVPHPKGGAEQRSLVEAAVGYHNIIRLSKVKMKSSFLCIRLRLHLAQPRLGEIQ